MSDKRLPRVGAAVDIRVRCVGGPFDCSYSMKAIQGDVLEISPKRKRIKVKVNRTGRVKWISVSKIAWWVYLDD